jgi:hypothetical protein
LLRILNKLPETYETTIDLIELEIDNSEELPEINYILEKLVLRYQRIQSCKGVSNKNNDKDDVALFGGGFKGNCNKCGKRGHKAVDCKSKAKKGEDKKPASGNSGSTESKPDMSNVSCNYCKEKGHMKDTCPKLAAKKAKAEADKGEVGLISVDLDKIMGECNYCGEIGLFCGPCKSCLVGVNDKTPRSIERDTGLVLVDKYCGLGLCVNCNALGIRGEICSPCGSSDDIQVHDARHEHSEGAPASAFADAQAIQCNRCLDLLFESEPHAHNGESGAFVYVHDLGDYRWNSNIRACAGMYHSVEDPHRIYGNRSLENLHFGFMELEGHIPGRSNLDRTARIVVRPTYPDVIPGYINGDEYEDYIDMRALSEIMNNDQNEIFRTIVGRLTVENYEIEQFLQFVGERMHPEWNAETVTLEFVQVYVYDFVRLNVETVAQLLSVIPHIQAIFRDNNMKPISDRMLNWMCAFAPVWIMAEFRYLLSRMTGPYGLPSQEHMAQAGGLGAVRNVRRRCEEETENVFPVPDTAMVDFSFFANSSSRTSHNNLWIGDSGASCHMTCWMDGMINVREVNSPVQVGTGQAIPCTKMGDKQVRVVQENGAMKDIVLKNCKYVPGLFMNLFSINTALAKDWMISNKGITISLDKDDTRISFDKTLRTDNGAITGVEMVPRIDGVNLTLEQGLVININKLHLLLGHACESTI